MSAPPSTLVFGAAAELGVAEEAGCVVLVAR
jgi:hypothetical protein